jgi:hypothetical protein
MAVFGFLAFFWLSGLLQAFWPSSDFLVFWLDCSVFCGLFCPHLLGGLFCLPAFWPSSGFLAFFRLSSLLAGLLCILRIVLSASSGWIALSTVWIVLSTPSLLCGLFCPHSLLSFGFSVRSFGALSRQVTEPEYGCGHFSTTHSSRLRHSTTRSSRLRCSVTRSLA